MRIKEDYLLKEAGDVYMLFPVGQNVVDYKGILQLNDSGYFIAKQLLQEITYDEILASMVSEYEAVGEEIDILRKDLDSFIQQLKERDILI